MPHERLQDFVVVNYDEETSIQAITLKDGKEEIVGIGAYYLDENTCTAEVAFAVKDTFQNRGIGTELLEYLTYLATKRGLIGFVAEVLKDNIPMLHVFTKANFDLVRVDSDMTFMKKTF
jgi:GNAT superfamily N-acetyltransferase